MSRDYLIETARVIISWFAPAKSSGLLLSIADQDISSERAQFLGCRRVQLSVCYKLQVSSFIISDVLALIHQVVSQRIITIPKATKVAARTRAAPNGSRKNRAPIIAANITLVSRNEDTTAMDPKLIA